jgi:hypothetical protein
MELHAQIPASVGGAQTAENPSDKFKSLDVKKDESVLDALIT